MAFWQTLGNIGKELAPGLPIIGQYFQNRENARVARENTDKTIAANRELAEYQYSKDLEMWNRGNEYNSPAAQMARLKEAGLNPNMMYGSSGATQPAVNLPKYQAPRVEYNYAPNMAPAAALGLYMDMRLKSAQLDNLKEEKRAKELANDMALDTYGWRKIGTYHKYAAGARRYNWERENYTQQQSYLMEKLRLANLFTEAQTELKDAQVEWYAGDKIASYLGIGGGLLKNLGGMFKSKAPIPAKGYNFGSWKNPSGSSRVKWRGNYIENFGYDN